MATTEQGIKNIGGGSLLVAWQLTNKIVLIVGGGEVASQRIESILTTDASITLLAPENGLHPRTRRFLELYPDRITHHVRLFAGANELQGVHMVLTALDDHERSREICEMTRAAKIPVNAADIPDLCDFYFGAQIRDGPLQIMISTNGNGPRLASLIKGRLQRGLSGMEGDAILKIGQLRNLLKERAPGIGGALGKRRMKWMTALCNEWNMEDMALLDVEMMSRLLDEGWERDRVPTLEEVGGRRVDVPSPQHPRVQNLLIPSAVGFAAGALCTVLLALYRRRR